MDVNVSQSPTDHYEIHALMDIILNNIPIEKYNKISADTIYKSIVNLIYLKKSNNSSDSHKKQEKSPLFI